MLELHVLHPMIVHFPVAMLFTIPIGLVFWSHLQDGSWHAAMLATALGAAISTSIAYATGPAMIPHGKNPEIMEMLMPLHETMALVTLVLSWLVTLALTMVYFIADYGAETGERVPYWARFWIIVLAAITGAAAAYTGHLGAQMVWGELL